MKEEFVSNGLARKLLAKGCPLDRVCKADEGRPLFYELPLGHPEWQDCDAWYAPTIAQVLGWLREEKKIYVQMEMCGRRYKCSLYERKWFDSYLVCELHVEFKSYEKAAIAGIEYVIDNLI